MTGVDAIARTLTITQVEDAFEASHQPIHPDMHQHLIGIMQGFPLPEPSHTAAAVGINYISGFDEPETEIVAGEEAYAIPECDCGLAPADSQCCLWSTPFGQRALTGELGARIRVSLDVVAMHNAWVMLRRFAMSFDDLGLMQVRYDQLSYRVKRSLAWRLYCREGARAFSVECAEPLAVMETMLGSRRAIPINSHQSVRELIQQLVDKKINIGMFTILCHLSSDYNEDPARVKDFLALVEHRYEEFDAAIGTSALFLEWAFCHSRIGESYKGQGLTASSLFTKYISPELTNWESAETVGDYIRSITSRLWSKVKYFLGFLSGEIQKYATSAWEHMTNYLITSVFSSFVGQKLLDLLPTYRTAIAGAALFVSWVVLKLLNIVTENIAYAIYELAVSTPTLIGEYLGQAGGDYFMLLSTLCLSVVGVSARDFGGIKWLITDMAQALAGGSVMKNGFKATLLMLPLVLKAAFTYRYGTKKAKLEFQIDQWRSKTQSLLAVSRIPTVVGTQNYASQIDAQVKEGSNLLRAITSDISVAIRSTLSTTYARLLTVHMHLTTRKFSGGSRMVPFAFHLAGRAGIGKSSMVRSLLVAACALRSEDVFSADCGSNFPFSGFQEHKAVVMDEFLLGQPDDNYTSARSYLTLVSNEEYRPDFASVDDPNVGIKGTPIAPHIVVTLNNVSYDRVDHKIDEALQRRRRFVIECKPSERYVAEANNPNNVDLRKYTPEERADRVWMTFDVMPGTFVTNVKPIVSGLTYRALCDFIKVQYEDHVELFEEVAKDMMGSHMVERTAEDVLGEVMRDAYALPSKPLGLLESLKVAVVPMYAQHGYEPSNGRYADAIESEMRERGVVSTIITAPDEPQVQSSMFSRLSGAQIATGLVATAAALLAIVSAVGCFVRGTQAEEETYFAQSKPTNKVSREKSAKHNLKPLKMVGQAQSRTVRLTLAGQGMWAIPVGGRIFATYSHAVDWSLVPADAVWNLIVGEEVYEAPYNSGNVLFDADADIIMVRIDSNKIPQFKDISKEFVRYDEVNKLSNSQIILRTAERTLFGTAHLRNNLRYEILNRKVHDPKTNMERLKEFVLEMGLEYPMPTESGDCGHPITVYAGPLANRIAGIHVAGKGGGTFGRATGAATIITREMVEFAKDHFRPMHGQGLPVVERPNLIAEENVNPNEMRPMPINSKLKPSEIATHLPWKKNKAPAILSRHDKRADGVDPVQRSLDELFSKANAEVDEKLIERITEELIDKYNEGLDWKAGKRQLSFEEACGGVPGLLNSLNMTTSPGYPLCNVSRKRGKTDFVWFEGQELCYTSEFRHLVEKRVEEMNQYKNGTPINNRVIAYLKDELRAKHKIEACDTRMTFADDMISLVAFRMVFGALLIAMMHSFECTGFAIGLNQYSKDMNGIFEKLNRVARGCGFGDFKSFDKNYKKQCEQGFYKVIKALAMMHLEVSENACDYMIEHESNSWIQVGAKRYKVYCMNRSGVLWTTPKNCVVNNFYYRGCFYIEYPAKVFDREVSLVVLGDDSIYSSRQADFHPARVAELMEQHFGQTYTSAYKGEELPAAFQPFDEALFLGARPRPASDGGWTGALRKETLEETPLWTRDGNLSLDQTVLQMIECASQWDRTYFENFVKELKTAYDLSGRDWKFDATYSSLHRAVSNRTAASGEDFNVWLSQSEKWYGQGDLSTAIPRTIAMNEPGITQLFSSEEQVARGEEHNLMKPKTSLAVSAVPGSLNVAATSWVRRFTQTWSNSQAAGTQIQSWNVPFDILTENQTSNAQDVGFMQYLYSQPTVEVKFIVNGTPVQQGLLLVNYFPLVAGNIPLSNITNGMMVDHLMLTPNNNTSQTIKIPFRYWRHMLNNQQGFTNATNACLGRLFLTVLSPLTTQTLPTTAQINVYSRFTSEFYVPRPRTANGQGFVGQGGAPSKGSIGEIAGRIPSQALARGINAATGLSGLPLDNPPLASGTVPVFAQEPSMASGTGLAPTQSLQFHPEAMHREPFEMRYEDETRIESIMARRGYLSGYTFNVATTDNVGTEYLNIELNSVLGFTTPNNSNSVPSSIALLNQFCRWRANIEIELFMAKTVFHSVRILAVAGYGVHGSLAALDYDSYPSQVVEFTGESQWASIVVPYNAQTEFLRTYDGPTTQVANDYSMGALSLICIVPLKVASSVVATACSTLVFCRFHDVEVWEPKANSWVSLNGFSDLPQLVGQMDAEPNGSVVGEAAQKTREPGDVPEPTSIAMTAVTSATAPAPSQVRLGRKYEYVIRDLCEVGRRHHQLNQYFIDGWSNEDPVWSQGSNSDNSQTASWQKTSTISFLVYPQHHLVKQFAAWSGTLKYRIVVNSPSNTLNSYNPRLIQVGYLPCRMGTATQTMVIYNGSIPPSAGTANSSIYASYGINPPETVTGATGGTWAANTQLFKPESAFSLAAVEYTMTTGANWTMIDVSVPFATNYNFLPTNPASWQANGPYGIDPYNGRLVIQLPMSTQNHGYDLEIWQAWGDDFRLHAYCPQTTNYSDGWHKASFGSAVTAPANGDQIGMLVFGN